MRVLLITGSFPPMKCGVGDYSYHLSKALASDPQIQVGILTSAIRGIKNNINRIEVFPIIKQWAPPEALQIMKIIRRWSPDIVHIQYPTQGYGHGLLPWLIPLISFMTGKKVVQTWHEGYGRRNAPELFLKSIIPSGLVLARTQYKETLHPMLRWALWKKKVAFIPIASNIPVISITDQEKNALKGNYLKGQKRLIIFFGFIYPNKGIELLFEIADPSSDQIVIAGEIGTDSSYYQSILNKSAIKTWADKATVIGFIPATDISALLAVADAVVLPFRSGGGEWNRGSVKASVTHGAFTITTSQTKNGYDKKHNIYYAKVDDVQEMKSAMNTHAGKRRDYDTDIDKDEWRDIANQHIKIYQEMITL